MKSLALISLLTFILLSSVLPQGVPPYPGIRLQGSLTDNAGNFVNGLQSITVRIYETPDGGIPIYTEVFSNLSITNGILDVMVNATTLPYDSLYWVETQLNNEVFAPRTQLGSVPYAFRAFRADTSIYSLGPWATNNTNVFYNGGNVGIGTSNPSVKLHVNGNLYVTGSITTNSVLRYYTVPGSVFRATSDQGLDYTYRDGESIDCNTSGSCGELSSSIHLPHNALIKEFRAVVYDNGATEDVNVILKRGDGFELANLLTNGISNDTTLIATGLSELVDNINASYQVYLQWIFNAPEFSNVSLKRVVIGYEISNPEP